MDYVGVKMFDEHGKLTGERRFVGLFTSGAYSRRPERHSAAAPEGAPCARARRPCRPTAMTARRWRISSTPIRATNCSRSPKTNCSPPRMGILRLGERPKVRVFLRFDRFDRFVSALVFVPRDRYDTRVREKIHAILAQGLQRAHVGGDADARRIRCWRACITSSAATTAPRPHVDVHALGRRNPRTPSAPGKTDSPTR